MEARKSSATDKPAEIIQGPTLTLYRFDIQKGTQTDEETNETRDIYTYQEYAFPTGEYDAVRGGILPAGSEWTAELRRIQRSALLDEADKCIMEAQDYISVTSGETKTSWENYIASMRAYKMDVRNTVNKSGFPQTVSYPEMPEQP